MVCSTVGVHVMVEKECVADHDRMFQEALKHLREDLQSSLQSLTDRVQKLQKTGIDNTDRIVAVEQSQKTVLLSARKSLEVAVKVQRRQEHWEARHVDMEFTKHRISPSSASIQALSSNALSHPSTPPGGWCAQQQTRGCRCAELDVKISDQDRRLVTLDREVASLLGASGASNHALVRLHADGRSGALQCIEAGDKHSGANLNALQVQLDEAAAPLYKISTAMPEIMSRLDMVVAQCEGHASKIGRHEVRLNMLAGHLEGQTSPKQPSLANGPSIVSASCSSVSGAGDDRELAGRVDAHSVAITEIFEQLQAHSETLGVSRSSSRSSLHHNSQAFSYAHVAQQSQSTTKQSTPAGSRSSSRGALSRRHGPPPQSSSSALYGMYNGLSRNSVSGR